MVVTLKDVALPAVGAKMSTTNENTAEIADPVGMIHVRLIEGVCTRSEDGQTTPASATTSSSSDIGRTDGAGQPPGDYLPRRDLDRTPSLAFQDRLPS